MKIMLVTDAWEPQVNGVVRTLKTTARELTAMGHEVRFLTPLQFRTLPCPTYPEIRLSLFPGAGVNAKAAHVPVIRQVGPWRVGLLGYYWNRRCAATADLPGSAMDPPDALAADIRSLRERVDRIVVFQA